MNRERIIQVFLTPHEWDSPKKPYFWCILTWTGSTWVNSGICGWAETPEKAWEEAFKESQVSY